MKNTTYNLPEIEMIGGNTKKLVWNLWSPEATENEPFNAENCRINFALVSAANKFGAPLVSKECEIRTNSSGDFNIAALTLISSDTCSLYGKFFYQLTIRDVTGNAEPLGQGIVYINRNIDQPFMTGATTLYARRHK